jgi:hypothetical protein
MIEIYCLEGWRDEAISLARYSLLTLKKTVGDNHERTQEAVYCFTRIELTHPKQNRYICGRTYGENST